MNSYEDIVDNINRIIESDDISEIKCIAQVILANTTRLIAEKDVEIADMELYFSEEILEKYLQTKNKTVD